MRRENGSQKVRKVTKSKANGGNTPGTGKCKEKVTRTETDEKGEEGKGEGETRRNLYIHTKGEKRKTKGKKRNSKHHFCLGVINIDKYRKI